MDKDTCYYVQLHLEYLQEIEAGIHPDDFPNFPSLYDHMHSFLLTLGLTSKEAWSIINELRKSP